MFKRMLARLRGAATSFVLYVGMVVVLILLLAGVAALPITFGETLTVLGVWAMLGALVGQNKTAGVPLGSYLNRRTKSVAGIGIMFCLIGIVYVLQIGGSGSKTESEEVFGLLVLAALGLTLGFVVGSDRDPRPKKKEIED